MALWCFFLFRVYSPKCSSSDTIMEQVFCVYFSSDIILELSFSYHAEMKKNFFSKIIYWPIPKCTTTKGNTLYISSLLFIYIDIYVFISLFILYLQLFLSGGRGGGLMEEHTNGPYSPLLLHPQMKQRCFQQPSPGSLEFHLVIKTFELEGILREISLLGRSCWLSLVPLKIQRTKL